jgi:hypothetical protein
LAYRVQDLEDEIESMQRELAEAQDEASKKGAALQDKEAIIELVEREVAKI